jgi:hypothetical protein
VTRERRRERRGVSGPGCLFGLVLLVVVGGWLALRGHGRDTHADRVSGGRWRPERAAAYAACQALVRARFEERGLVAAFPRVDPTTRASSTDGRTFLAVGYAVARSAGTTLREPFRCVLERDAAAPDGWRRISGPG